MGKTILRFFAPLLASALAVSAFAAPPDDKPVPVTATHLVGLPSLKSGDKATLTIQDGTFQIAGKVTTDNIKLSSIEDILTGTEETQAGGKMGKAAKVGAAAAPYDSGAVLTLILRTKVDLLTVLYRGEHGGLHSVLLVVPKGQAEPMRSQMLAGGAHASERKP
jgi:hypothetical protein